MVDEVCTDAYRQLLIRKFADNRTGLQGLMIFHACSYGIGSDPGDLMIQLLSVDYEKKSKLSFTIQESQGGRTPRCGHDGPRRGAHHEEGSQTLHTTVHRMPSLPARRFAATEEMLRHLQRRVRGQDPL